MEPWAGWCQHIPTVANVSTKHPRSSFVHQWGSSKSLFKYVWKMVIFLCLSFLPHVLGQIFCSELSFFNKAFCSPYPSSLPWSVTSWSGAFPAHCAQWCPPPSAHIPTAAACMQNTAPVALCLSLSAPSQGFLCLVHSSVSTSQELCDRACASQIFIQYYFWINEY